MVPVAGAKDQFVVGVDRKVLIVEWDTENNSKAKILSEIAEVDSEAGYNTNRLNDGKADPSGRLYGGMMMLFRIFFHELIVQILFRYNGEGRSTWKIPNEQRIIIFVQ